MLLGELCIIFKFGVFTKSNYLSSSLFLKIHFQMKVRLVTVEEGAVRGKDKRAVAQKRHRRGQKLGGSLK